MRRPPVALDLRPWFSNEDRGHSKKTLIVCHETVSHNRPGLGDVTGVAAYLDATGLEIHGIIDQEGHFAWCYEPTAIFDHAASGRGSVNTRSIGIELVSEIPLFSSKEVRRAAWESDDRKKQLNTLARVIAWLASSVPGVDVPLRYSDASRPGITSHWSVSRTYLAGDGHWDCWPIHMGGHFPALYVVQRARQLLEV